MGYPRPARSTVIALLHLFSLLLSISSTLAARPRISASQYDEECRGYATLPPEVPLPENFEEVLALNKKLGSLGMLGQHPEISSQLRNWTRDQRDVLAWRSGNVAIYFVEEGLREAEDKAVLQAVPPGRELKELNGINIGAGGHPISPYLLPIDLQRGSGDGRPSSQTTPPTTLLAWGDRLPFAPNSLDIIVSQHNLEHISEPIKAIHHYLDLLKPGGGLGLVMPDWQYAMDARFDSSPWGHKWNTEPQLLCRLYHRHFASRAELVALQSYKQFKLSFDFVLRKHGEHVPFSGNASGTGATGRSRYCDNKFLGIHRPFRNDEPQCPNAGRG